MKKAISILIACFALLSFGQNAQAQLSIGVSISANIAPPPLPVYTQPLIPADGYLWAPGYWAYDNVDGYYWVPGVWVRPPQFGFLWTPAYWGFVNGAYGFHGGYWGPHVGFYGGINYGFGYGGIGYGGGVWAGNAFRYNTAVSNVNTTIVHNTYINRTVINNNTTINNNVSYNGQGGVTATPTAEERTAMNEHHIQPTTEQLSHQATAGKNRNQFASVNHGAPATTAMDKVHGRNFNQQGRISNGISSGRLTTGETKNLENREANTNNEARRDKAANGGHLSNNQQNQINQQQNKTSRAIYNDKHNAANAHYGNNREVQGRGNGVKTNGQQPRENNGKHRDR
ncbi:MAG: YXWGXW repeat-containing protein [Bacteroidota bacterium]|nr:YXWGXW repeat-containing protein [Bacteroidota bacterium]